MTILKNLSPIKKNILAFLVGVGVQLLNQIVLVPFYIIYWGNERYSDWIVLSAITSFFLMSDIGLNTVIQNRFSIKFAERKIQECDSLLTNNYVIVTIIMIFALVLSSVYLMFFDIVQQMHIYTLSRHETNIIFIILVFSVFIKMYSGVENAIYRATHNASRAVFFDQISFLFVTIFTFVALILHLPLTYLSFLIVIPDIILVIIKHYDSRKFYLYKFHASDINIKLLKSIFIPSISFMSFPLGNAIILQGYTLLVNRFYGADSVVLYNTTRTMCNFIKTLLLTIQKSVWPEYSISYGKKDFSRMRHLHRKAIKAALISSVSISLILLIGGPLIYKIWTHNTIVFSYSLMISYLIVINLDNLWNSSSITLMATNNHMKLGIFFVSLSILSIGVAYVQALLYMPLYLIVCSLLIIHIPILIYAIKAGLKLTHDKINFSRYKFTKSR